MNRCLMQMLLVVLLSYSILSSYVIQHIATVTAMHTISINSYVWIHRMCNMMRYKGLF